jgi:hypothetical protein
VTTPGICDLPAISSHLSVASRDAFRQFDITDSSFWPSASSSADVSDDQKR